MNTLRREEKELVSYLTAQLPGLAEYKTKEERKNDILDKIHAVPYPGSHGTYNSFILGCNLVLAAKNQNEIDTHYKTCRQILRILYKHGLMQQTIFDK